MSAWRRGPRSLVGRVVLAAVVAVGAALAVGGTAVVVAAGRSERAALDRELRASLERLERPAGRFGPGGPDGPGRAPGSGPGGGPGSDGVGGGPRGRGDGLPGGPPGGPPGRDPLAPPPGLDPGADRFSRVVLPDGTVARSAGAAVPSAFPAPLGDGRLRTVEAGGERWRSGSRPLPGGAALQVAARLTPLEDRQRRLQVVVLLAALGALGLTALAAYGLARLALAPLGRLRERAGEVARTADLGVRVPEDAGLEEIDALGRDLNAMLGRLGASAAAREAALESVRRFAADAGHELRTPLTSLGANLAALERGDDPGARAAALADARRLERLVDGLQALARGEGGPPRVAAPVDLGDLADAALGDLRRRHPGVTATLEAPEEGPDVRGDAAGLRALLDNLLENAARHGRPGGGHVTVRLDAGGDGDGRPVTLLVEDDGPGVPAAEREAVLERFTRGSRATADGSGLGLPIAVAQARRHGGGLALEEAPGGGLRVRVTIRGVAADAR